MLADAMISESNKKSPPRADSPKQASRSSGKLARTPSSLLLPPLLPACPSPMHWYSTHRNSIACAVPRPGAFAGPAASVLVSPASAPLRLWQPAPLRLWQPGTFPGSIRIVLQMPLMLHRGAKKDSDVKKNSRKPNI